MRSRTRSSSRSRSSPSSDPRRRRGEGMKRMLCLATGLFLLLPAIALAADETPAEEKFDPSEEWTLHPWVSIHIGPIDMSINKAVAYLLLGALLSILLGIIVMRVKTGK